MISPKLTMTFGPLSVTLYYTRAVERGPNSEGESVLSLLITWAKTRMGSDRGATMVEYGLLIVLIALVAAAGALALGGGLGALFNRITACLAADGICPP